MEGRGSAGRRPSGSRSEPHPARRAGPQAARAAQAFPRAMGLGPGNREGPRPGRACAAGGLAGPGKPRANTSRGPPASPPASPRQPAPGKSFVLGPPGAPGGPRTALTGGGQQGAKVIAGEAPSAGHRFLPKPTPQAAAAAAAKAAAVAAAAAAAATPAPESAAAVAAAPLPLRSPLPLRPEPRPAPAPAPHWASGPRGCPGRPRGALTEGGEGERRPGRRGRGARRRRAEGDGNGGGKRRWEKRGWSRGRRERVGTWGLGEVRAWAGVSPRCCALCLGSEPGGTRTTVSGVIRSLPTQKGIATGSEAEVSPLSPCVLGILDLGKDRNCFSLNFRLIFPLAL